MYHFNLYLDPSEDCGGGGGSSVSTPRPLKCYLVTITERYEQTNLAREIKYIIPDCVSPLDALVKTQFALDNSRPDFAANGNLRIECDEILPCVPGRKIYEIPDTTQLNNPF